MSRSSCGTELSLGGLTPCLPAALAQVSLFGGATVQAAGTGFVAGLVDTVRNRSMSIRWGSNPSCIASLSSPASACTFFGSGSPPSLAADNGLLTPRLLSSDGASATFSFSRYTLADLALVLPPLTAAALAPASAYMGNTSVRSTLRWRLRVNITTNASAGFVDYNFGTGAQSSASSFCGGRTPLVTGELLLVRLLHPAQAVAAVHAFRAFVLRGSYRHGAAPPVQRWRLAARAQPSCRQPP